MPWKPSFKAANSKWCSNWLRLKSGGCGVLKLRVLSAADGCRSLWKQGFVEVCVAESFFGLRVRGGPWHSEPLCPMLKVRLN